ncbi:MAG: phosphatase PAP2 family protein [Ferruginibacter sp.]|nr:phosphatase PAP2 family protein [Chitinophagaceae bacterium]
MIQRFSNRIKKGWAGLALLSVELIIILVVFILSLIAFIFITRNVFILKDEQFDYKVFTFLESYVNSSRNNVMLFFTFLGTHLFLIPANILLIIYFLFIKKHRWYSIKIPVIALTSLALMFILKNFFGRQRPDIPLIKEVHGLSFPSGHALMSVTFYGLLIHIVWNTVKRKWLKWTLIVLLVLLILIIGFTRIYLRVHYPSDVFAGFATGFLWLVTSLWVVKKLEQYSKRKAVRVVEP